MHESGLMAAAGNSMNVQDLLKKFENGEQQEHVGRSKELTKSNSFSSTNALMRNLGNGDSKRKCFHEEVSPWSSVLKSNMDSLVPNSAAIYKHPVNNNIYGKIMKHKAQVDGDKNGLPMVAAPVAPKKPPRTFAHDIYLSQKKNRPFHVNCGNGVPGPEVKKPAPPPKPSFSQCQDITGFNRDRKYSMPTQMCTRMAMRPSTPPPPRPPPCDVANSSQSSQATNTIPRSSKKNINERGARVKHIYDEPTVETRPVKYGENGLCNTAKKCSQDKIQDLHYMSTPVCVMKNSYDLRNFNAAASNVNNNEVPEVNRSPTKKSFNLVRDMVNWSVSCIGQPLEPPS